MQIGLHCHILYVHESIEVRERERSVCVCDAVGRKFMTVLALLQIAIIPGD